MKQNIKKGFMLAVATASVFSLTGCVSQMSLASQALSLGTQAYGLVENTEINGAKSPNFTKEDFQNIKKVALNFEDKVQQDQQQQMLSLFGMGSETGGNVKNIIADNMTTEFLKLGIDVMDRSEMPKIQNEQKYKTSALDLKEFGVNALVTGNITTTSKLQSSGFSGMQSHTLIQNATFKVVDTNKGTTMLSMNVSYKNGQKPVDVAKTLATILKAVITYPELDPKEAYNKLTQKS